jgi:hypothetical protein
MGTRPSHLKLVSRRPRCAHKAESQKGKKGKGDERRGTQTETTNLFGLFAAASSPVTKSSLSAACCATAAAILQKALHIFPPIVVGDFLPQLDSPQRHNHYTAPASYRLCIRPTGMIDVTCKVPSRRAVDRPSLVDLKLISGAACLTPIGFLGGNAPAAIGRDIDPSLDWLCRKQTEPSYRTANPKGARGHCSWNSRKFL